MFNLLPMWVWAAVCAVAFAAGGTMAWQVQNWRYGAKEAGRLQLVAEQARKNERTADLGTTAHEADRAKLRTQFITVTKVAERVILEKPFYRNVCMNDDGLRILATAITGQPATGEPAPAVLGPDPTR